MYSPPSSCSTRTLCKCGVDAVADIIHVADILDVVEEVDVVDIVKLVDIAENISTYIVWILHTIHPTPLLGYQELCANLDFFKLPFLKHLRDILLHWAYLV